MVGAVAALGVLAFWKKRSGGGNDPLPDVEIETPAMPDAPDATKMSDTVSSG